MGFAIHIIESPNQLDLLEGREEGAALQECFRLMGVKSERFLAVTPKMFGEAVKRILESHAKGGPYSEDVPMLHFSCHGNEHGIGTTSGYLFKWTELADLVRPVNEGVNGVLFVGLSSCQGYNAFKMAETFEAPPFGFIFGPRESVSWEDSLVAFMTFYHLLLKEFPKTLDAFKRVVSATNAAAGLLDKTFDAAVGNVVKKDYENAFRESVRAELGERRQQRFVDALANLKMPL
jgi:hypothetical protein